MNGYELSRSWFDWCFENPELHNTNHTALYMWICEKWNRLGQKEKFGLPTNDTMEVLNIKSKATYLKVFYDLVNYGFIKLVAESKNQHASKVIALCKKTTRHKNGTKTALDIALIQHENSTVPIEEPINQETSKQINNSEISFESFWDLYDKKSDREKAEKKWDKISLSEKEKIMAHIPSYKKAQPNKKYRKDPCTFLNNKSWENELIFENEKEKPKELDTKPVLIKNFHNANAYYLECISMNQRPLRYPVGLEMTDDQIEQEYKTHKVGKYQYE